MGTTTLVQLGRVFDNQTSFEEYLFENAVHWNFYFICTAINTTKTESGDQEIKDYTYMCDYGNYFVLPGSKRNYCPCMIQLQAVNNSALFVKKVYQCHNHIISRKAFMLLPHAKYLPLQTQIELIDLKCIGINATKLRNYMLSVTGRTIWMRHIEDKFEERLKHFVGKCDFSNDRLSYLLKKVSDINKILSKSKETATIFQGETSASGLPKLPLRHKNTENAIKSSNDDNARSSQSDVEIDDISSRARDSKINTEILFEDTESAPESKTLEEILCDQDTAILAHDDDFVDLIDCVPTNLPSPHFDHKYAATRKEDVSKAATSQLSLPTLAPQTPSKRTNVKTPLREYNVVMNNLFTPNVYTKSYKQSFNTCNDPRHKDMVLHIDNMIPKPGDKFESVEKFREYVDKNARRFHFYYFNNSSHGSYIFRCYMYRQSKRKSLGLRKRTPFKTKCPCKITLKKFTRDGTVTVIDVCNYHDHPVTDEYFLKMQHGKRFSKELKEEIKDFLAIGADVPFILGYVLSVTGIKMTKKWVNTTKATVRREKWAEKRIDDGKLKELNAKIESIKLLQGEEIKPIITISQKKDNTQITKKSRADSKKKSTETSRTKKRPPSDDANSAPTCKMSRLEASPANMDDHETAESVKNLQASLGITNTCRSSYRLDIPHQSKRTLDTNKNTPETVNITKCHSERVYGTLNTTENFDEQCLFYDDYECGIFETEIVTEELLENYNDINGFSELENYDDTEDEIGNGNDINPVKNSEDLDNENLIETNCIDCLVITEHDNNQAETSEVCEDAHNDDTCDVNTVTLSEDLDNENLIDANCVDYDVTAEHNSNQVEPSEVCEVAHDDDTCDVNTVTLSEDLDNENLIDANCVDYDVTAEHNSNQVGTSEVCEDAHDDDTCDVNTVTLSEDLDNENLIDANCVDYDVTAEHNDNQVGTSEVCEDAHDDDTCDVNTVTLSEDLDNESLIDANCVDYDVSAEHNSNQVETDDTYLIQIINSEDRSVDDSTKTACAYVYIVENSNNQDINSKIDTHNDNTDDVNQIINSENIYGNTNSIDTASEYNHIFEHNSQDETSEVCEDAHNEKMNTTDESSEHIAIPEINEEVTDRCNGTDETKNKNCNIVHDTIQNKSNGSIKRRRRIGLNKYNIAKFIVKPYIHKLIENLAKVQSLSVLQILERIYSGKAGISIVKEGDNHTKVKFITGIPEFVHGGYRQLTNDREKEAASKNFNYILKLKDLLREKRPELSNLKESLNRRKTVPVSDERERVKRTMANKSCEIQRICFNKKKLKLKSLLSNFSVELNKSFTMNESLKKQLLELKEENATIKPFSKLKSPLRTINELVKRNVKLEKLLNDNFKKQHMVEQKCTELISMSVKKSEASKELQRKNVLLTTQNYDLKARLQQKEFKNNKACQVGDNTLKETVNTMIINLLSDAPTGIQSKHGGDTTKVKGILSDRSRCHTVKPELVKSVKNVNTFNINGGKLQVIDFKTTDAKDLYVKSLIN